nr:hypothetical protein [Tanacetum cinerariifolium]
MGGGFIYFCFFNGPGLELLGLSPDTRDRKLDMAYQISWIRRVGSPGYDVSDLLDTAYQTYWVWHIGLFRYGVLGSLGTAYWLFGYGVFYFLGMAYRASWVRSIG